MSSCDPVSVQTGSDYEFRFQPILHKGLEFEVTRTVARRVDPAATIWVFSDVRAETKYAHILCAEGLAIFMITEITEQQGAGGLSPWVMLDRPTFFWHKSNLPDAIDPSRLIVWYPFTPEGSVAVTAELSGKLRDLLLPALMRWPDREDLKAINGDPVEVLPFHRTISVQGLPR